MFNRPAELVHDGPSRLVAQAQFRLQGESAGAGLLSDHFPHGSEPLPQRKLRVLKNGASQQVGLMPADLTGERRALNPVIPAAASLAGIPLMPLDPCQVSDASFLGFEELPQSSRFWGYSATR